jgi:hypothetical protein
MLAGSYGPRDDTIHHTSTVPERRHPLACRGNFRGTDNQLNRRAPAQARNRTVALNEYRLLRHRFNSAAWNRERCSAFLLRFPREAPSRALGL